MTVAIHDIPPKPPGQIRIVTWNVAGAVRRKAAVIDSLDPDIAVIQECRRTDLGCHFGPSGSFAWTGPERGSSLPVIAGPDWTMAPRPATCPDRFFLPVTVHHRRVELSVLGVWVKPAEDYLAHALRAIHATRIAAGTGMTIMAGDFNANVTWDRPGRRRTFASVLEQLAAGGLASAWHAFAGERHGFETAPTFHLHRSRNRPCHIDCLFVRPALAWKIAGVRVGSFEHWIGSGLSDHVPVVLDLHESGAPGGG